MPPCTKYVTRCTAWKFYRLMSWLTNFGISLKLNEVHGKLLKELRADWGKCMQDLQDKGRQRCCWQAGSGRPKGIPCRLAGG